MPSRRKPADITAPAATANAAAQPRFIKVSAAGLLLPADATDWVAVYQPAIQLTWTRRPILPQRETHPICGKAARALKLCGRKGWQLPSRLEFAHLIDDDLVAPCVDATFFDLPTDWWWYWTRTPYKGSKGAFRGVYLDVGVSLWSDQGIRYHALAVLAGQFPSALGKAA